MPATKPLSEVLKQFPDFKPGWSVDINGVTFPTGTVARIWHPTFGSVEHDVVMKPDGTPAFDRPRYHEAPFGQTVLWGKGADGKTRLGFIAQERPHADAPGNKNYGKENQPVLFLTCVMGFKDSVRGKVESDLAAARREVSEEVAKKALILSEWEHLNGHNPSPSFTSTWGAATALQVDLASLVDADDDPAEPIAGRFWLTVSEWKMAVAFGYLKLADGRKAYTCYDVSVATVQMFLCAHPEIEREAFESKDSRLRDAVVRLSNAPVEHRPGLLIGMENLLERYGA